MHVTVADLLKLPKFQCFKLLAGQNGLFRPVDRVGILDYEYDYSLKDKFLNKNFIQNQLILTSFLYARDQEHLIMEAVKNLIGKGCSGLGVRNVFRLPIGEQVLRYADSRDFPVFLIEGSGLDFDEIIIAANRLKEQYETVGRQGGKLDELLAMGQDRQALERFALSINPSLESELIALYFCRAEPFDEKDFIDLRRVYQPALSNKSSLFYYKNGFMLIHSRELFGPQDTDGLVGELLAQLGGMAAGFSIGVSAMHHNLHRLKNAVRESLYAQRLGFGRQKPYYKYEDLGIYQPILMSLDNEELWAYSRGYIRPLMDYDDQYKAALLETACAFVRSDGSIEGAARALGQHASTVRYRLDKINHLFGDNFLSKAGYERLSLAVKIDICLKAFKNLYS